VYLGLLDIKVLIHGGFAYDGGNTEDALSSYATKYDVCFHNFNSSILQFFNSSQPPSSA